MRIIEAPGEREAFRHMRDEAQVLEQQMYHVARGLRLRTGCTWEQAIETYQRLQPTSFNRWVKIQHIRSLYARHLRLARRCGWTHAEPGRNHPAAMKRAQAELQRRLDTFDAERVTVRP